MTDQFTITLEAARGSIPAPARLKRLLKALLRGFGFRCVAVTQATTEGTSNDRD